jgi:hypothetical protein
MKHRVYHPAHASTEELKAAIEREMRQVTPELCARVFDNLKYSFMEVR